jgi:IPT/TIG domain
VVSAILVDRIRAAMLIAALIVGAPVGAMAKVPTPPLRHAPPGHAVHLSAGHRMSWSRLPRVTASSPSLLAPRPRPTAGLPSPSGSARRTGVANALLPTTRARTAAPGNTLERLFNGSGISREQQISLFGTDQATEPPDVQIAAGPSQLVEFVNSSATIWSKSGLLQGARDLNAFFGVPNFYRASDTRVVYDPQSSRWLAAAIGVEMYTLASKLYLAVSSGTDPQGDWTVYTLADSWYLYDQPKLGVTSDKLIISWNQFHFTDFVGQVTEVLQKSDLLAGSVPTAYAFNPDKTRFNLVPVPVSGGTTAYLVYNGNVLRGTPYAGPYAGAVAITGTPSSTNVTWTEWDLAITPTSTPPAARQFGGPTVDTGSDVFLSTELSGGTLWTMGNDGCRPGGDSTTRSCLRLIGISLSGQPTVFLDLDEAALGYDLYYPAGASDRAGNLYLAFSASALSPEIDPSAFAGVLPAGTVGGLSTVFLALGGTYDYSVCYGPNRWGDYFGASPDPIDGTDVWVAAEYQSSVDRCDWGTRIGRLTMAPPTVASVAPSTGTSRGGTRVTIRGTDFVPPINYFTPNTTVSFGGVDSPNVDIVSPDELIAVAPRESSGTVSVTVTTANGTSNPSLFTFTDAPPAVPQSSVRARTSPPPGTGSLLGHRSS